MRRRALAAAGVCILASACSASWEKFTPPGHDVSVLAPEGMQQRDGAFRAPAGEGASVALAVEPVEAATAGEVFAAAAERLAPPQMGAASERRELTVQGRPAYELEVRAATGPVRHRLVLDGGRLVHLEARAADDASLRELSRRFFDSLVLPPAPAAAVQPDRPLVDAAPPSSEVLCLDGKPPIRRDLPVGDGKETVCLDAQGQATGRAEVTHGNGRRIAQGEYVSGKKTGLWTFWRPDGTKERETTFLEDVKEGRETLFNAEEERVQEGEWRAGAKHGLWVEWSERGVKVREAEFKNGKQHGRETTWDPNGAKLAEGGYVDDKRQGKWQAWHDNGRLQTEGEFDQGVEIGVWKAWDRDGKPEPSRKYEGSGKVTLIEPEGVGCPHGATEAERDLGPGGKEVWCERPVVRRGRPVPGSGVRDGPAASFDGQGKKRWEGSYVNGRKDGTFIYYGADGRPRREETWQAGRLVGY